MVTEKWSEHQGASQEQGADGKRVWRDRITYQVTEAPTEADAAAQLPYEIGSEHPVYGAELLVTGIFPRKRGPNGYWEMEVIWGSDAVGSGGTVNQRAKIRWGRSVVVEEVDRDFDGHPITNSVGDPPVNTPTREFFDLILTYSRWEPEFNLRASQAYVNAINYDDFAISFGGGPFNGSGGGFGGGGKLKVYKGECKCSAWEPAGEYEETQSLVQVVYEFQFRARMVVVGAGTAGEEDDQWASGFDWRFLDQGNRGAYLESDGTTERLGEFYLRSNEPATDLVRLNGYGKPLRDTIKVTSGMVDPLEFSTLPAGASLDGRWLQSDPAAAFLIYKKHARLPFRNLIPLFR